MHATPPATPSTAALAFGESITDQTDSVEAGSAGVARPGSLIGSEFLSIPGGGFARPAIARRIPAEQSAKAIRRRGVKKPACGEELFIGYTFFNCDIHIA